MRRCPSCGLENDDTALTCETCRAPLPPPEQRTPNEPRTTYVPPEEEIRFWERMTFRQFALLMVRLQALWLLFYAIIDLTYMSRYLTLFLHQPSYGYLSGEFKRDFALSLFRVVLHVAAALLLLLHGERVLTWLVKDWAAKQYSSGRTPNQPPPQPP